MNDEIKEILDRLERIDHKEYSGGFEFADSTSFNEMARCFEERKIMANYITDLQQKYKNSQITLAEEWKKRLEAEEKIKHLDNQITMLKQQNNVITEMGLNYKSRNEKAIEHIEKHQFIFQSQYGDESNFDNHLLDILKGDDENEEK